MDEVKRYDTTNMDTIGNYRTYSPVRTDVKHKMLALERFTYMSNTNTLYLQTTDNPTTGMGMKVVLDEVEQEGIREVVIRIRFDEVMQATIQYVAKK